MPSSSTDSAQEPLSRFNRIRQAFYLVFSIIGIIILLAGVAWVLGRISMAIWTLVLAAFVAFLLHTPVDYFERKGIPRPAGAAIAYIILFAVIAALVIIIGPLFGDQIVAFLGTLPTYVDQLVNGATDLWNQYGYLLSNEAVQDQIRSVGSSISSAATSAASSIAGGVVSIGTSVVSGVVVLLMGLVAAFWILMDLPRMSRESKILAGPKHSEELSVIAKILSRVCGGYIKGIIVASCCTGIIAGIGFSIIGVPYAIVLGLLTACMNIIPYVGPWISGIVAGLIALFVSPITALLAVVVSIIAQQFTDAFVTPRVMSTTVDIHPILTILCILAGGAIGGIGGMVLAVPVVASCKAIFVYFFEKKTGRQLVTPDGAFFRGAGTPSEGHDPLADATGVVMRSKDGNESGLVKKVVEAGKTRDFSAAFKKVSGAQDESSSPDDASAKQDALDSLDFHDDDRD